MTTTVNIARTLLIQDRWPDAEALLAAMAADARGGYAYQYAANQTAHDRAECVEIGGAL